MPVPRVSRARRTSTAARHIALGALLAAALVLAACAGGGNASTTTAPHSSGTPSPTVVPPVIYVAIGASDAVGVGADNPNTDAYVPLLIARLPKGSRALNLGISGNTMRPALTNELPPAIAAHPTLITIWMAGNDFRNCTPLDQYASDLDTLLGQLRSQTQAHVFVANLPDMSRLPVFQNGAPTAGPCLQGLTSDQIRAMVLQWNGVIAAAIARHRDVLVDLYNSPLASHPDYIYRDGFHPSTAGYQALANLFWAQITAHDAVPAGAGA